jgi:phosphatidylglycerol lysyltransferase
MSASCFDWPGLIDPSSVSSRPQDYVPGEGPLEKHAYHYGRTYDSYIVTEPGWQRFWSRELGGVVGLVQKGKYLYVGGGLLAPPEQKGYLLAELVEHAAARGLVLTFFNIADDELPLFRRHGFQVTKWGEEALVDLADCSWSGKDFAWVRRQSNFCRRQGLVVSECRREMGTAQQWHRILEQLTEISNLFLAGKPQSDELRLLLSRFDPKHLGRKRIFVARAEHGKGRIEGFLACNPCAEGATWVLETYRQRPDAVRGTIPFLMHQVMDELKGEGVARVSLCLIPGLRCQQPLPGDSRLARWGLAAGTRYFGWIFDTAGAYHFKSRFRPRFESRYLCVRPKMTFGSAWALVEMLGVLKMDVRKLCQTLANRWRKRASRGTLQGPGE